MASAGARAAVGRTHIALFGERVLDLGAIDGVVRIASPAFRCATLGEAVCLEIDIHGDPHLRVRWLAEGPRQTAPPSRRYLGGRPAGVLGDGSHACDRVHR